MKKMFVWMAAAVVMMSSVACTNERNTVTCAEEPREEQVDRLLEGLTEENYPEKMDSLRLLYPEMTQEIDAVEAFCEFMVKVDRIAEQEL